MPLITLPGVSPDLSIMRSIANLLKRKFYTKRYIIEKAALVYFLKVFDQEIDQIIIQCMYNKYTKRLHDCLRAKGQMTKY
jgi:hypothetical protein